MTDCARQFPGAISVPGKAVAAYVRAIVDAFLAQGVAHVCLVNNHLEPAHEHTLQQSLVGLSSVSVSLTSPRTKRWAKKLSAEFQRGECHAGQYETSLLLSDAPEMVRKELLAGLPQVPVSLSQQLRQGKTEFMSMGLTNAYAGNPASLPAKREIGCCGL